MSDHSCIKCSKFLTSKSWTKGNKRNRKYICITCDNRIRRERHAELKKEVINVYGGKCACCNEDALEFLSIDHIDGRGAEHRRKIGIKHKRGDQEVSGINFYRWLKNNNYPKDNFQVLCFNCNVAKHIYGKCPHKSEVYI